MPDSRLDTLTMQEVEQSSAAAKFRTRTKAAGWSTPYESWSNTPVSSICACNPRETVNHDPSMRCSRRNIDATLVLEARSTELGYKAG